MTRVEPRNILLFGLVAILFIGTGMMQSWNSALGIFNMGLVSAIMALGVNMQWGYAGLFNVGIVGFTALGGLAAVLVSMPPVPEAWAAGGPRILLALLAGAATIAGAIVVWTRLPRGWVRVVAMLAVLIAGYVIYRAIFDPARDAIESVDPALTGYLGGLGLPVVLAWPVGGLFAAGAAWIVGKVALGLRSDYLAIATLGIAEIIIAVLKNEDWLGRGVKNVTGLPRPVPYEIDLQQAEWFIALSDRIGANVVSFSSIFVKLSYAGLFIVVILALIWLSQMALNSPWGRMMRAIRDNEVSASAMGKNVTRRHLQIFILGSAVCGLAGAMMTTLDGQLVPSSYNPLRFTFLVWVMVIVGGSGNNWGAVLGGFLIWWLWIMVEPMGLALLEFVTSGMAADNPLREHLIDSAAHMRLLTMGIFLLVMLRFAPRGLIPEK
ncbi:branched-chain amino acid ABC transporter permease [Alterinioella nitratireducens]|uniref:branched-chain amino acid ABC transporter permease n=1 Tax=Alterinioella nitratireducens TaxID=2735915 RepID=UPI0015573782|nr:branched-chain amino acid ABC transporter permease [Alterinioella nitratireducens]NPD18975.1 branched-chain amino acid ABC transporter permease [Alterinioella nitratireducens]